MRDRLLPEVLVAAIFADEPLSRTERDDVIATAMTDPTVLRTVVDVLIAHVHKSSAAGFDEAVTALAKHPKVRASFRSALTSSRESRARGPARVTAPKKTNPGEVRLTAADPRLPSAPLGELVAILIRKPCGKEVPHAFDDDDPPVLAHNVSGLLILGGSYRVGADGFAD